MAFRRVYQELAGRPLAYLTIPTVAAGLGVGTNWLGVKMLFYPIEFIGSEVYRGENAEMLCTTVSISQSHRESSEPPSGRNRHAVGWQGVVPARTEKMATRLTEVVSTRLFSLREAFARLETRRFAELLQPTVERSIREHAPHGRFWRLALKPFLPLVLRRVVEQLKQEVNEVLDPREVVLSAFMRDKRVLVEMFQKVGKMELSFLVESGSYFGFGLGLLQMCLWAVAPKPWTLPVAGAVVGYATNWMAVTLMFDPVEPVTVGPFVLQGMFEKRQAEVSEAMADFLAARVLTSPRLLIELVDGRLADRFRELLRRQIPAVVPDTVVDAVVQGLRELAAEPEAHATHAYVRERLAVERTLCDRLLALPSRDFADLLHPVFQEDEIILIVVGGILGALAGLVQMRFGWVGPATAAAAAVGGGGKRLACSRTQAVW